MASNFIFVSEITIFLTYLVYTKHDNVLVLNIIACLLYGESCDDGT